MTDRVDDMAKRRKNDARPVTRNLDFNLRAEDGSDGMTLVGLAVPFDVPTRIDGYWFEDSFDEQFKRGAFKRTIAHDHQILQFNHGFDPRFGELPIGEIRSLTETKAGLEVEARLFEAPELEWLREAISSDAINGMSIRFRPMTVEITAADARDGEDVELRSITEADLRELGPVVFPAYPTTEVGTRDLSMMKRSEKVRLFEALAVELDRHSGDFESGTGAASPPANVDGPTDLGHPDAVQQARRRRALIADLERSLL